MTLRQKSLTQGTNRRLLWLAVLLILITLIVYLYTSRGFLAPEAATSAQVQTAIAQRGNLIVSASGTGTLIAESDAAFGFETDGRVMEIFVQIGDQVEAGQVLAQLDDTLARMEYIEAEQALLELYSAASIATVQQEIGHAQDAEFHAREWLEYLLSPEVVEAEENLAAAEQKLAEARGEAAASPSDVGAQSVKEKEQAVAYLKDKLAQAQQYYEEYYLPETFGTYENAGSRRHPKLVLATYIDPETAEEVPEISAPSIADIATARSDYVQAQETVREGEIYLEALSTGVIPDEATGEKLSALYSAQLALRDAQSALEATQLVAPIAGTVTSLDFNIAEQVDTSPIMTISQLGQPYDLEVYFDETDWNLVQAGNQASVAFDLLPEQTFSGTVTLVYPELNSSFESSIVHLIVQLDQTISQDLPAGTGATVDVIGGDAQGVVLAPVNAIHKTQNGGYALTVLQDETQVERSVEIGLQNESYAEVISGLEPGEIVVTE